VVFGLTAALYWTEGLEMSIGVQFSLTAGVLSVFNHVVAPSLAPQFMWLYQNAQTVSLPQCVKVTHTEILKEPFV
jgi:hypothetical protein